MKMTQMMTTAMVRLASLVAAATLTIASPMAQACKDCPFPSKVADGRWLMPNKVLQIEIDLDSGPNQYTDEIQVVLRDIRSGLVVAKGTVIQRTGRRTVVLDMIDRDGHQIKGYVHYLTNNKQKIEAKFTCQSCTIQPMLD